MASFNRTQQIKTQINTNMSAASASAPVATSTTSLASMMNELQASQQKTVALQEAFNAERTKRIAALHTELGFANSEELVTAIRAANGKPAARRTRKAASGRKERITVTSEIRKAIIADAKEGKLTGLEIAEKHGVSVGTVQNIKKDAGLVK